MISGSLSIHDLKLSPRDADTNTAVEHRQVVRSFKRYFKREDGMIRCHALDTFRTGKGEIDEAIGEVVQVLTYTALSESIYDLGVVNNDQVNTWAEKAVSQPISSLPWAGRATTFIATHPNEVPHGRSLSIYPVWQRGPDQIQIAEILYIEHSDSFLMYGSILARMPFGSDLYVMPLSWTGEVGEEFVNSMLQPALMAVAFLATSTQGAS